MKHRYIAFFFLLILSVAIRAQTPVTVFSDDFSTNTDANFTTSGAIGGTAWTVGRSGADWGARRNPSPQQLELTNDASGTANANGWVAATVATSGFSSPYLTTLNQNLGTVEWTFNMRQIRTDPAGFGSGSYGVAFVLAGSNSAFQNNGSGYAVVLGQSGGTDPIRLVRYNNGLGGTLTNIIVSNTTGLDDFGAEYLSIKVTYNPTTNSWELLLRNDGASSFADPATGTLTSQGVVSDATHTATVLGFMGAYWQGSTAANQTAFFDNVTVIVNDPSPTLTRTPASLSNFGASVSTPSRAQSFSLVGSNLDGTPVTITAPVNFEVSSDNLTFSDDLTVTYTGGGFSNTYFARLKSGLSLAQNYSGAITFSGGGTTSSPTIALSGRCVQEEPTVQAFGIGFSAITSNSFTITWARGNGASVIVLLRQGAQAELPNDGQSYSGNSVFGLGDLVGTETHVVYIGAASSVSVSNLISGQSYSASVLEFNGSGGLENYHTTVTLGTNSGTATALLPNSFTSLGQSLTENFNSMGTSASAPFPAGWRMSPAGSTAPTWTDPGNFTAVNLQASTATSFTGGRYNFGDSANTTNRALGIMTSGTYASPNSIMSEYFNQTGSTITVLSLYALIKRYRINVAPASVQFFYSTDGTTWIPSSGGTIASTELPTAFSAYTFNAPLELPREWVITNVSIPNGAPIYFRWNINTGGTNSQAIGLDSVVVTANALAPEPTVQHSSIPFSNIVGSTATVQWSGGNGARTIVVMKAGSAVDVEPSDGTSYVAGSVFGTGDDLGNGAVVVFDGVGTSATITGLNSGTPYHLAFFTYNGSGLTANYLTPGLPFTFSTAGTPPVTNLLVAPVSGTSAQGSWTLPLNYAPATGTILVFAKEGAPITIGTPTLNAASYTANSDFTGISTPYEHDPLARCVFNGDASSVTITNLTQNATKHYLVFHVANGTAYSDPQTATVTQPQQRLWTAAVNNVWTNPGNWNPTGVPQPGEFILINGTTTIIDVPTDTIGALILGDGADVTLKPDLNDQIVTVTASQNAVRLNTPATRLRIEGSLSLRLAPGASAAIRGRLELNSGVITRTGASLSFEDGSTFNLDQHGGTIPQATWAPNSTVLITGYSTATIPPSGLTQLFGNFSWQNGGQTSTVNFGGALTSIQGNLTVLLGGGNLNLTSAATLSLSVGGDMTLSANSTGTMNVTTGSASPTLTIEGNVTINANANFRGTTNIGAPVITVGGNWTTFGSTVLVSSTTGSAALTIGQDLVVSGSILPFQLIGGVNNPNQVNATIIGNVILNNGTLTVNASTNAASTSIMTIGGDLELNNGTFESTRLTTLRFSGGSGSSLILSGGANPILTNFNFEVAPLKTAALGRSFAIQPGRSFTVEDFGTLNTNTFILNGGSGTFTLNAGGTLIITDQAGISMVPVSTGNIQTGTRTFSPGARYIYSFSGNGGTGGALPSTVKVLEISNATDVIQTTLNAPVTVSDTLRLTRGNFNNSSNAVTLAANASIIRQTATLSAAPLTLGQYNLTYAHTSGGVVAGNEFLPTAFLVDTLVINHTGTEVVLNASRDVRERLRLVSGVLNSTASHTLRLFQTAEVVGGSNASYFVGRLTHQNTTTPTDKRFPFGEGGIYRPITLTLNSSSGVSSLTGTMNLIGGDAYLFRTPIAPALVSGLRYYQFETGDSASTLTGVPQFRVNDDDNIGSFASNTALRLGTTDASPNWILRPLTAVPNTLSGTLPIDIAATGFSQLYGASTPFGVVLASADGDNPLPVELTAFTARSTPDGAHLEWRTASETDNAGFLIYRDGVQLAGFGSTESLRGQGTSSRATRYSFLDSTARYGITYTYQLKDVSFSGVVTEHEPITLTITERALPTHFDLAQNYPNPFNPSTTIRYQLPQRAEVRLELYDMLGRKVSTLFQGIREAGYYDARLTATALSSGVYFYRIQAGSYTKTLKLTVLK